MFPRKIKIMGEKWRITIKERGEDPILSGANGYCRPTSRDIVICDLRDDDEYGDPIGMMKHALKHELVHSLMFESGIGFCSHDAECWGTDEEIVDWIAKNSMKLFKLFRRCGLLC